MVLSFNKDDNIVGIMSERVFTRRHSPSVKLTILAKVYDGSLARPC